MSAAARMNWQAVEEEVRRRIHARIWAPGEMIPNEQELAEEFGCARATVNRALRHLSEAGLLERRRKAGTRVALHPVRKATLSIPMLRKEVEARGAVYGYRRLELCEGRPASGILARMGSGAQDRFIHVRALHLADGAPFAYEDRWIDVTTLPAALEQDFAAVSANEWLIETAPYTHGDIAFFACSADAETARQLGCAPGAALFATERITWDATRPITFVRQHFAPGYRMYTQI